MKISSAGATKKYDSAVAKAAEWVKTLAGLNDAKVLADAQRPETPADLSKLADQQASIERQIRMAEATLADKEADVLAAAKDIVSAAADDLQPEIDRATKDLDTINSKTAELRRALEEHTGCTWVIQEARGSRDLSPAEIRLNNAERALRSLRQQQAGLRAAVAGQGIRDYFPNVDDLPAVLHPVTGVLPQAQYREDLDRAAAEEARLAHVMEGEKVLTRVARKLQINEPLYVAEYEFQGPSAVAVSSARQLVAPGGPSHVAIIEEVAPYIVERGLGLVVDALRKGSEDSKPHGVFQPSEANRGEFAEVNEL